MSRAEDAMRRRASENIQRSHPLSPGARASSTGARCPAVLGIERTDEGADVALAIDSGDGTKTIMRFRIAALPKPWTV